MTDLPDNRMAGVDWSRLAPMQCSVCRGSCPVLSCVCAQELVDRVRSRLQSAAAMLLCAVGMPLLLLEEMEIARWDRQRRAGQHTGSIEAKYKENSQIDV